MQIAEVTWTLKNEPIKNERLKIENEPYKTKFMLLKAKRADSGIYVVTAVNDSGKDSVELELTVLGKPGEMSYGFELLKLNVSNNTNFVG